MKSRDVFKLAVRIVGLIFLYHGLSAVPVLFLSMFGRMDGAIRALLLTAWPLMVGFALLRYAPKFVATFYPESEG